MKESSTHIYSTLDEFGVCRGGCLVFFLVLVFRLPLKLQGLEAGRRLQQLVDQWSDSVWQVLCSYNKGEITAYHFVCTHIQGHMHSLSLSRGPNFHQ